MQGKENKVEGRKDKRYRNGKDRKWGLGNSKKEEKRREKNRRGHKREREWREYFIGLLGGVEERVVEGGRRERGGKNRIERWEWKK